MLPETLERLALRSGAVAVDGTVGGGGHTRALCEAVGAAGRVIGLDRDPAALAEAERELSDYRDRLRLVSGNFAELAGILAGLGIEGIDALVLDLGVSSYQLNAAERGFSFSQEGPLDMRMNPHEGSGAQAVLERTEETELARRLQEAGEGRYARAIARAVVRRRQELRTTRDLARLVEETIPRRDWPREIHPATKTFLALRLAVNRELESLEAGLAAGLEALNPGGRMAVLSYHSLEAGLVKRFFRRESKGCICPPDLPVCGCGRRPRLRELTRKPVRPGPEEAARNPRSRSAELRAAEKLGPDAARRVEA